MEQKKDRLIIISGKLVGNKADFNGGTTINICFNPGEYSLDKGNTFSEAAIPGLDSPSIQFSSGKARTLSLDLLLDTYTYGNGEDIREKYIENKLDKLIKVDGHLHAPPICKVVWGTLEFVGVLEKLTKKYILFKDNGTPVRARVSLGFKEYIPVEIQIKKSPRSSPDRHKLRVIKEGDSLWQLSYKEYGDSCHWRNIADENGIDNPMSIKPGDEIVIPPLEKI